MPAFPTLVTWNDDDAITTTRLNEIRDALQHLRDWGGNIAYQQEVADSAGFTTTETTLVTLAATIPSGGRDIELKAALDIESTVAGDEVDIRIKQGGTTLMKRRLVLQAAGKAESLEFSCRVTEPAAGANTYVLKAIQISGTGTIIMRAGAERPAFLRADAA